MKYLIGFISLYAIGCLAIKAQQPIFPYETIPIDLFDSTSLIAVERHGLAPQNLNLGNAGSPFQYLLASTQMFETNSYATLSRLSTPSLEKYSTTQPMTYMHYVMGSKKEQYFNVYHTQNFSKNSNLFVRLDKVNNVGFFQNQSVNNTHVYANYYTQSKSNKYHISVYYDFTKHLQSLNGGLTSDSLFLKDSLTPFFLYDVNLLNASQELKQSYYEIAHDYRLSKPLDSINSKEILIFNKISYRSNGRNFYDSTSLGASTLNLDYYNYIYNDSLVSNDDLKYQQMGSTLGILYKKHSQKNTLKLKGFLSPSYNIVQRDMHSDTSVIDLFSGAKISFTTPKHSLQLNGSVLLNDRTGQNDFKLNVANSYRLEKWHSKLKYGASYKRLRPSIDLLSYKANTVRWNNNFEKPEYLNAYIIYSFKKDMSSDSLKHKNFGASVYINYFDNKNPIFFDFSRVPNQIIGFAQVIQSGIDLSLETNRWKMHSNATYQYQGGFEVYRLPTFWGQFDLGYKFKLFKRKMDLETGLSLTYFSKFQSRDFDVTSGQFFLSNTREIGAYPFGNLFIKGRIQRFTYFLMSSHPHEGFYGMNYMQAPLYPSNGRMFKIGFSWLFVN